MTDPCKERLPDLVDAAEGVSLPQLEAHLRDCSGCRDEVAQLRADLALLQPDPAPHPGPWLATRVRARAEQRRRRTRRGLLLGVPASAVAFSALLVMHIASKDPPVLAEPSPEVLAEVSRIVSRTDAILLPAAEEVELEALAQAEAELLEFGAAGPESLEDVLGTGAWGLDLEDALADLSESELETLLTTLPG